jgi:hypothetical protein
VVSAPLPLIRRLGVRTAREIEEERHALLDMLDEMAPVAPGGRGRGLEDAGPVGPLTSEQVSGTGREADFGAERPRVERAEEPGRDVRGKPEYGAPGGW